MLFIIKWDAGYGSEYEEVEAKNEDDATRMAYDRWHEEVESTASYSTVGLSTKELRNDYLLE